MKGLVFSVKDYERCCIPNCNNISNTFAFPRLKKKDWSAVLAKYFKEPDWQPQSWTRICADHFRPKHVFYTNNRPVRLDPRANPFIDVKKYPLIKQEPIKPTLIPKLPDPPVRYNLERNAHNGLLFALFQTIPRRTGCHYTISQN